MNRVGEGGAAAPRRNVWVLLGLVAILGGLVAQPIIAGTAGATGPGDNPAKGEDSPVTDSQDGLRSDPIPPELVGNEAVPLPASKSALALDDIACVGNGTSGKRVQLVYAYRAAPATVRQRMRRPSGAGQPGSTTFWQVRAQQPVDSAASASFTMAHANQPC